MRAPLKPELKPVLKRYIVGCAEFPHPVEVFCATFGMENLPQTEGIDKHVFDFCNLIRSLAGLSESPECALSEEDLLAEFGFLNTHADALKRAFV